MRIYRRLGPSLTASLAWHAIVLLIVFVVGPVKAGPHDQLAQVSPSTDARIVWLNQPGPGGGGGGGGNRMAAPPRAAEARGKDRTSVPVSKPPNLEAPQQPREPEPLRQITIPATSLAAAADSIPGAIEMPAVPSTRSQGPGVGGGAGTGTGPGDGPGTGPGLGPGRNGGAGGDVYRVGNGVTPPVEVRRATPRYTTAAMQARVQGAVIVECVVQINGTCTGVHVIRSLDPAHGLDQEAVNAAGQWRFRPGTRLGEPVPVLVTLEITFTIR